MDLDPVVVTGPAPLFGASTCPWSMLHVLEPVARHRVGQSVNQGALIREHLQLIFGHTLTYTAVCQ